MGHETYVEVDDVHWFGGEGPKDPVGPCPHECQHNGTAVIAWGPSLQHYELVQCDDVCAGSCRAWESATRTSNGGIPNSGAFLLVA